MWDRNPPRLILYNERDMPVAIFYVDTLYVPVDNKLEVEVLFDSYTAKVLKKGYVNLALLHMPNKVYRVQFNLRNDFGFLNKDDEVEIRNIILPQ